MKPAAGGDGGSSFDVGGAHFAALFNGVNLGDRRMGRLGADQLAWLNATSGARSAC